MGDQSDLFAQPDNKPDNPRKKRLEWFEQPYEDRARIIEAVAAEADKSAAWWANNPTPNRVTFASEQARFHRERAEHLRKLAQRMRTEKRPLA